MANHKCDIMLHSIFASHIGFFVKNLLAMAVVSLFFLC